MRHGTNPIYFLCVGVTIALVVVGWIYTTRNSIVNNASTAKKEFSHSLQSAKKEFVETKQIDQTVRAITTFLEEKEAASDSVIESLKQKIEENEYVQKTTTE